MADERNEAPLRFDSRWARRRLTPAGDDRVEGYEHYVLDRHLDLCDALGPPDDKAALVLAALRCTAPSAGSDYSYRATDLLTRCSAVGVDGDEVSEAMESFGFKLVQRTTGLIDWHKDA